MDSKSGNTWDAGEGGVPCEVVSVAASLCARIEAGGDLKQAAYNTIGAIAMQGVRQADLRLGEICAVIGLASWAIDDRAIEGCGGQGNRYRY